MMDFPKAAVIGLIGDAGAVPHDYTLDGLDLRARILAQAEMESRRRSGESVVVRSSDPNLLRLIADEVWWMDNGSVQRKGHPEEVLAEYERAVLQELRAVPVIPCALRRGDGRASLLSIETRNGSDKPVTLVQTGQTMRIRVAVRFAADTPDPVVGIMIRTRVGMEVYGTNTELERLKLGPCAAGETRVVTFEFECSLCPQFYTVTAASHDPDGVWHDWMEDAIGFTVTDTRFTAGVANLRARLTYSRE